MSKIEIEGMKQLEKTIKKLGELPQKCVNQAARKGALIAKRAAKRGGFVDQSGYLRRGIVLRGEKSRAKGKKVFDVTMDKQLNDVFVKVSKQGNRAYYPGSQEYGFKTANGGYVPGFHFLRNSLEDNASSIANEIVSVLSSEIDKLK